MAALKTGAVDLIESVPVASVEELRKMPGIKTVTLNTTNNLFIQLATHVPGSPWTDVRVRKAAAHAIDMDAIIKSVLFGQGERYAQLSPDDFGYDPNQKPYAYDPKKSRQLLAEAGFPRGFETPCYNFTTQREPNLKEVGEAIFAYFGAVGIRCKPMVGVEYTAWLNLIRRWPEGSNQKIMDGAPAACTATAATTSATRLQRRCTPSSPQRGFGSSSNTSIPELDRMIEEQKRELDPDKRIAMIRKIAEIKHDQVLAGVTTYRPLVTHRLARQRPFRAMGDAEHLAQHAGDRFHQVKVRRADRPAARAECVDTRRAAAIMDKKGNAHGGPGRLLQHLRSARGGKEAAAARRVRILRSRHRG